MPRFFVEKIAGEEIIIAGEDARHISRSLRMRTGDSLVVCDTMGVDFDCSIVSIGEREVTLRVLDSHRSKSEPDVEVTLYQGYPKGDKLETVIEKAVELGVSRIVPVLTERSVARPDASAAAKKLERWKRHSLEAAKQCGRGIIPVVEPLLEFSALPERLCENGLAFFCYELGGRPIGELLANKPASVGIFIGPEGGISAAEAEAMAKAGAVAATLGPRILRTETAPIAAIAAVMLLTGNLQ